MIITLMYKLFATFSTNLEFCFFITILKNFRKFLCVCHISTFAKKPNAHETALKNKTYLFYKHKYDNQAAKMLE